jgi:regulator of protease activity HflC (stomatin/prohibitin superfamily)
MNPNLELAIGAAIGFALLPLLALLFRQATIQVEDEEAVAVLHFGKLERLLKTPGLHVHLAKLMPWVKTAVVSLKRDFRLIENVVINDAKGTTLVVDLWVEFRIADPEKALFAVSDWDKSLQNVVSHAATSLLGSREFRSILTDRTDLSSEVFREIGEDAKRWGIVIEFVFIRNVSLTPDISRQVFEAIGARLRRAQADIDEMGRIAVAKLEAETQVNVASLVAQAKGQYPAAIGRALANVKSSPEVFAAYNELYALSQLRPHRTIAFRGFGAEELRPIDAAMLAPGS